MSAREAVRTERTTWRVVETGPNGPSLPPIVLNARTEPFEVQDYLTVDEARRLAEALVEVADIVEAAS